MSLTRDIEKIFFELKDKEPQPITNLLVEVKQLSNSKISFL
ncbi:hypothetical protein [Solibacillus faecavium]|nr:hypothetical protein [Solibacillus faecavium]